MIERFRRSKAKANGKHQPAWENATIYPLQGDWTEEEYLELDRSSEPRLLELNDGVLEFLPIPDMLHQDVAQFLFVTLRD